MRDMDSALSTVPPDPLSRLNDAQRAAVLHGDGDVAPPLLVIAGAGTGKTNTLVHRLAHLVSSGADPRRILVMTFSRRAAAEMTRRAERIAAEVLGPRAAVLAEGLIWTGTFHAIGARLLREQATAVGLDPAFTIHDREDSADLMALARHRLGLTTTERRFPAKGTCLAIYSRTVNARADLGDVLRRHFPWCAEWEAVLRQLFAAYVAAKQESAVLDYDDLLLLLGGDDAGAGDRRGDRRALRPRPRRRVPGHQPPAGGDPAGAEARRPGRHRRRRRRPVDLRLPGGGGAQHPRLPRTVHPARPGGRAGAELPLDAGDPRRRQRGDRRGGGGIPQVAAQRPSRRPAAVARRRARRERAGRLCLPAGPGGAGGGHGPEEAGGALPHRQPLGAARGRARAPQHPLRQVRGPQVPRQRPRQGRARLPAFRPEPRRPHRRLPGAAAHPRRRRRHGRGAARRRARRGERPRPCRAGPPPTGRPSPRCSTGSAPARTGRANSRRSGHGTRPTSSACTRTRPSGPPTSCSSRRSPRPSPTASAFSPRSPSTRRGRAATTPACPIATRTT